MDEILKDTEWWWIDYLENEFDSSLEKDLETLLQHSQDDRDSFENFRLLKAWLSESDPIAGWPIEERCARMRGHVMTAIEGLQIEPAVAAPKRLERPRPREFIAEP